MAATELFLVLRLGIAYTLVYSLRNLITTASSYLFDVGDLNRKTFAIMQTISFFFIFVCKFASGPILRLIKRYNHLVLFFICLQIFTSISFTSLGTAGVTQVHGNLLASLFVAVYCIVKLTASFTRVTILELLYRSPQKQGEGSFGAVSTILQVLSCVGDAGGKYALGLLLNANVLQQYSTEKRIPKWCLPMLIIANTSILGIICTASLFYKQTRLSSTPAYRPPTTTSSSSLPMRTLAKNGRFLICCGNSLITSAISVAVGTYGSHFMRYKIGINSEKVPLYDGVSPFCILFGVGIGGYLINRYQNSKWRVLYFMMLPFVLAITALGCLSYVQHLGFYPMLILYYIHQTTFYAFQNSLDGAYLMCIVEPSLAPTSTGIVSGVGYLGGLLVPFIILKYSTSAEGWSNILQVIFGLEIMMLLPMAALAWMDIQRKR